MKPDDSFSGKIEVLSWLNKMTLDVIGLAGVHCGGRVPKRADSLCLQASTTALTRSARMRAPTSSMAPSEPS